MHARITKFKMKPDSTADARALMESLKGDIMRLPGMQRFIYVMNDDGSGYTVSLIDEGGTSAASVDRVRAIWRKFHDHLETMPTPEIYEVIADWP